MHMSFSILNKTKGLSEKLFRLLPYILALLLWAALSIYGQYYLKKVEDLSLFLFDSLYLKEAAQTPGGLLGAMGSFLTQFLYYPWLGALIWTIVLLSVYQLTIKAFDIPKRLMSLAVIPAALLVIANMSLGYGVYIMREPDHFFAPSLGYLAALIPLFTFRHVRSLWGRILFLTIWTAAGYPVLGMFAFLGTVSASLTALTQSGSLRKERFTLFASGIILVLVIPLIEYSFYTSYRMADSWIMGLPVISEDAWTRVMRAPYQLALLFIPVMATVSRRLKADGKSTLLQASVLTVSVLSVWIFWFKDDNFHIELAMSESVDRMEWQKVVDIYDKAVKSHSKSDERAYKARSKSLKDVTNRDEIADITERYRSRFFEPTRTMIIYRDMALLKLNRALEQSFTMKDGGRPQKSRCLIPMAYQSGKQIYLHYGLINLCYRWCQEDLIEHDWSYGTLKYMAMHSIIMGESEFAYKYLNKLRKTIFYRRWAREQTPYSLDSSLMAANEPYKSILPYMCFEDRMVNDMVKCETFLMRHYTEDEPPHATPEYDRAALLWAMRMQNIPLFWNRLYLYINSNKVVELPRSVQEAALLYSKLEKPPFEIPFSKQVTDSYDAFNRFIKSNPIRNMEESAYPYYDRFGKTFFYYYYFIRNLQTY